MSVIAFMIYRLVYLIVPFSMITHIIITFISLYPAQSTTRDVTELYERLSIGADVHPFAIAANKPAPLVRLMRAPIVPARTLMQVTADKRIEMKWHFYKFVL